MDAFRWRPVGAVTPVDAVVSVTLVVSRDVVSVIPAGMVGTSAVVSVVATLFVTVVVAW